MSIPVPRPGLVIRYGFLWSSESDRGLMEGRKDRPCAIVVAAPRDERGHVRTIVAPITHSPPADSFASLEIPAAICRALELDEGRHWVRLDELNRFVWPGYDLRPRADGRYEYGMLPRGLFEQIKRGILEVQQKRKGRIVGRDE
ncbi:hypothetical protein ACSBOB_23975 [Mesorhizobium sp. ASY16-5R]|uniref:hypothetical protein n=1 Tax=Mesorhizobium sp. ASY16-5R TaxID=3445772 RepID=UPI003F9F0F19